MVGAYDSSFEDPLNNKTPIIISNVIYNKDNTLNSTPETYRLISLKNVTPNKLFSNTISGEFLDNNYNYNIQLRNQDGEVSKIKEYFSNSQINLPDLSLGDYLIIHNDPSFDDLLNISINNGSLSISQDKIKVIYIETLNSWWNIVYESKSKYNTLEITNDNNIYDKIDEEILDVTIGNKTRNVDKLFNQRDSENI